METNKKEQLFNNIVRPLRPTPKPGTRYLRTMGDRLLEHGIDSYEKLALQADLVIKKVSSLPSQIRKDVTLTYILCGKD